jgi:multiple sugar transport system ATP-binding protein
MRAELRDEIVKLHKHLQTTFIYVTHDQAEAMHMGSRIVVMNEGRIIQAGTPQEVYNYPNSMFVAGFVGAPKMNFFASRIHATEGGWAVQLFGKSVPIPEARLPKVYPGIADGMKVILGIRPEELQLHQGEGILVEGTARKVIPMGAGLHVEAYNGNQKFLTVLMNHTDVNAGDGLKLTVDPWCIHVFDPDTEQNLCRSVYKEAEQ